jgi:glycerophosphoryl diester phosphodiesterase
VLLQSFTVASLQILHSLGTKLPVHFLVGARDAAPWITDEGLTKLKGFATGISPEKTIVTDRPDVVARIKAGGFVLTPYTFRSTAVAPGYADVAAEMAHLPQACGCRWRDNGQPRSHAQASDALGYRQRGRSRRHVDLS